MKQDFIPYPSTESEFEVQAQLWRLLKQGGFTELCFVTEDGQNRYNNHDPHP
jgi:hypothetical protein